MKLDSFARALVYEHRRKVIAVTLATVFVLSLGLPGVVIDTTLEEFRGGTEEHAADAYVDRHLSGQAPNSTAALVVVRDDENVLTTDRYRQQLRAQQRLRNDPVVGPTLVEEQQPLGLANVVAIVAIRSDEGQDVREITVEPRPSLEAQIAAMEDLSAAERRLYTAWAVGIVMDGVDHTWPEGGPFATVPTSYEGNGKYAESTAILVSQRDDVPAEDLAAAQTRMADIVDEEVEGEAMVIGDGVIDDELRRSSFDSLGIVGPLAFLFILLVLLYAYRDVYDVALGLLGVGLVLVWTFGFMGWAGITFNQLFVAVPVLLMGLSIDYAIHVFMRYREERPPGGASDARPGAGDGGFEFGDGDDAGRPPSVRKAMGTALAGVTVALALVTATTATGFLSNVVSEVQPIRQFGVVSAVGILGAFVVFALLIPALKVELDRWLEARGHDRRQTAFGTEGGRLSAALAVPIAAARLSPKGVLAAALVVTLVAGAGAATVDTTFEQEDLLVEEVPDWMEGLGPLAPGEYTAQENIAFVDGATYIYDGTSTQILVRGDVTANDTLERVQNASDAANGTDVVLVMPDDTYGTQSPVRMMGELADDNESFAETFEAADTDGDGVPDRNLEAVYDAFYAAAPDGAGNWVHREDGEYVALRIVVPVDGTAGEPAIAEQVRSAAEPVDGDGLDATATGQPIMNQAVAENLLSTVLYSLAITLAVVLAVLMAVYRRVEGYASLGAVTLVPIALAVVWITGSMAALGIPFNVMTALITSFTIGLGIDYCIHVSERYVYELNREVGRDEALENAVLGTGGALLGSTASTAGGIAILGFALLVPLQQFGVITALTIVYAFVGSVVVLPSLLALWTEWADADPAAVPEHVQRRGQRRQQHSGE
ncbi:MMPL family transporter [Natronomonas salina]|uniref:efflux RND transporter permease subunit n=1 Tax=Natronomonas salina TaxID=1710540 RepID=UPI0015B67A7A|nr:MMPL family transporter [Natronomonas salina]QLD89830.1 MMPL family transporter [Natronomonas salina]